MSVNREYKTRIGSVTRRIRGRTGTSVRNAEQRTPDARDETASVPAAQNIASAPNEVLLPPPNGERNELRGFDTAQTASAGEESTEVFKSTTSSPRPSPPLHEGEGDGIAPWESLSPDRGQRTPNSPFRTSNESTSASSETSHTDAREVGTSRRDVPARVPAGGTSEPTVSFTRNVAVPRTATKSQRPYPETAAGQRDVSAPKDTVRQLRDILSDHARNHVTRQELQRELDSLRRLMETRN
jgi:hypothetical protein